MPFLCPWTSNEKIYDEATFHRLAARDKTEIGRRLNQFRLALVHRYTGESDRVLDVGIGAGTFMDLHGNCLGFDINPYAVTLLRERGLYFNPYCDDFEAANIAAVTFFDSLEHISDVGDILGRLRGQVVIVSLPIFRDARHMQSSRHFKPDEHVWHFTRRQFEAFMLGTGFVIVEERDDETRIGREDICTFVLKRRENGLTKIQDAFRSTQTGQVPGLARLGRMASVS
jgi:hypothetical protein